MKNRIWTPSGNAQQVEIDIAISQLQYSINQLEVERQYHRNEGVRTLSLLEEVRYALKYLRKNHGIVISIVEYQTMIREEKRHKKEVDLLGIMVHDCNELIEMQKQQIEELAKKRETLATKILEFKGRQ